MRSKKAPSHVKSIVAESVVRFVTSGVAVHFGNASIWAGKTDAADVLAATRIDADLDAVPIVDVRALERQERARTGVDLILDR